MISIVIPTHNEETRIDEALEALLRLRGDFEVIVVDGESDDQTCRIVSARALESPEHVRLIYSQRGRAAQLNYGAQQARGSTLLFLHADARLPEQALLNLERELAEDGVVGGNFDLEFDGDGFWDKTFTLINRWRRRFGVYYGDSGIFVRRPVFESLQGYRPLAILEDYDFARRLERSGQTLLIRPPLKVSSRRWRVQGVWLTLWSWVIIQALYLLGVPPYWLARWYKPVRNNGEGN